VATAAYQVEGAVDVDGRGESIWDHFAHTPGRVDNGDTGDVACDHYHRYRDDIGLVASLGLDAYRFSISWPRIMPAGVGPINEAGLDFYDRLVDELLARGIAPHATLYHWDLPQALEDLGGWPERTTADAFADYASIVANRLGDRVRHFATINEPWVISMLGYRFGIHAPGRTEPAASLAAAHHLLVAHGLATAAIRAAAPNAKVGIALNFEPNHPASPHPLDLEAASLAHGQMNRWFLDPLTRGDYPEEARRAWGWDGAQIRDGDMAVIAAPIDFVGVNYYTRQVVRSDLLDHGSTSLASAVMGETTDMGWELYPAGLTEVLEFVRSRTGALPLYVTENGAAYATDEHDPARDPERVEFIRRHLEAALDAIDHGIPLAGYFVWSLLDNFEWHNGYRYRFGIVHVDYGTQERTIRDSGRFLAEVAAAGALPRIVGDDAA
jgi:beta-glucosidase